MQAMDCVLALNSMSAKLSQLWPEIILFITTCVVMVLGLSPNRSTRKLCGPLCLVGIVAAMVTLRVNPVATATPLPALAMWGKVVACVVGFILILLLSGTVDREIEASVDRGAKFDSGRAMRGEFYALAMFSLTGLLLCAGSDDLIFLFLALELTSLPTYVMVALSTNRNRSMEAGVKYFFLGAMGAAMFLFGFALIYGGTGATNFMDIHNAITAQIAESGGVNTFTMAGMLISVLGVMFKIAAVPMHFYTPDVYQGASATVSGFLAFVPKAAGFFALMLLVSLVGWRFGSTGWQLPEALHILLWVVAALTMTVGNVLAIMQTSVKRILAYSSVAHSGYMLVGLVAGPGPRNAGAESFATNGLSAIWFYLLAYGVTTIGAFAVVASLEKRGTDGQMEECDHIDDFRGLIHTRPLLGWIMVISSVGLLGLPPLLGFFGKLPLFASSIRAGEFALVIVLALNSAIAAYYYLRLAYVAFIDKPGAAHAGGEIEENPFASRRVAGALSMACVVGFVLMGSTLGEIAQIAGRYAGAGPALPKAQRADAPASVGVHAAATPVSSESESARAISGVGIAGDQSSRSGR